MAAAQRGVRVRDAGARVGDEHDDGVLAVVHVHREGGALGGVPEDVAEHRVDGGDEFGAGDGDPYGRVDAGEAYGAALVLGERGPEVHAVADHFAGVAAERGPFLVAALLTGGADQLVDLAFQLRDGGAGLIGGRPVAERRGVEAEDGERGAQAVREVGGELAFVGEELHDLVGHGVERDGRGAQFRRAVLADAHAQLPLPELGGGLGEPFRRAHQAQAEAVRGGEGADDQAEADAGEDHPGGGDAVADRAVRHVHLDHRELARAQGRRLEQGVAAGHGGDGGAAAAGGLHVARGGPASADVVRLVRVGALACALVARYVDRHPPVPAGLRAGDRPFELVAVGGDGERGPDLGRLSFGVGEGAVPGQLLDDQPEGHGEGQHHHHGDGQRNPDERPSHACSRDVSGSSSFTPTPRTVCR